jgi:putative hydrolase of HD superfamily
LNSGLPFAAQDHRAQRPVNAQHPRIGNSVPQNNCGGGAPVVKDFDWRMNSPNTTDKLGQQIQFIVETEKLKSVLRRNSPVNAQRRENSAEHSWSLALMAIVLGEHADRQLNSLRVLKLLLIHDIVEIDADDTDCFDTTGNASKAERENRAAERIFNLLPAVQAAEFRELWREFESRVSPEAVFANALDRFMPLLQIFHNNGNTWRELGVTGRQAISRFQPIGDGSAALWDHARSLLAEAEKRKFFSDAGGKS